MPIEPKPTLSLHRKLAQVAFEAARIPKNGTAPAAMGGFKFVQVGDAADVIRKALAEQVVSMIPTAIEVVGETEHATSSGKMMTTLTVRTTWTLTDGESGETTVIQSLGSGADMGDKAAPKAQSNAMKYALLMGFLLSTGDDPELSDSSDRQRPQGVERPPDADANRPDETTEGAETVEFLGNLKKAGTVTRGGATQYKAEFVQTPEGHAFGFRLKLPGDERDIPQVLITGAYGDGLFLAYVGESRGLLGAHVTVKGRLYNVRQKGRTSYYRLIVGETEHDIIETPVVRIPAESPEAESIPMLPLDDEEKRLIAGSLP